MSLTQSLLGGLRDFRDICFNYETDTEQSISALPALRAKSLFILADRLVHGKTFSSIPGFYLLP